MVSCEWDVTLWAVVGEKRWGDVGQDGVVVICLGLKSPVDIRLSVGKSVVRRWVYPSCVCVMRQDGAVCKVEWGQGLRDRWGLSGSSWPCCWECPVEEVAGCGVGRLIPCKAGVARCPDDRDFDVFWELL